MSEGGCRVHASHASGQSVGCALRDGTRRSAQGPSTSKNAAAVAREGPASAVLRNHGGGSNSSVGAWHLYSQGPGNPGRSRSDPGTTVCEHIPTAEQATENRWRSDVTEYFQDYIAVPHCAAFGVVLVVSPWCHLPGGPRYPSKKKLTTTSAAWTRLEKDGIRCSSAIYIFGLLFVLFEWGVFISRGRSWFRRNIGIAGSGHRDFILTLSRPSSMRSGKGAQMGVTWPWVVSAETASETPSRFPGYSLHRAIPSGWVPVRTACCASRWWRVGPRYDFMRFGIIPLPPRPRQAT